LLFGGPNNGGVQLAQSHFLVFVSAFLQFLAVCKWWLDCLFTYFLEIYAARRHSVEMRSRENDVRYINSVAVRSSADSRLQLARTSAATTGSCRAARADRKPDDALPVPLAWPEA